MLVKRSNEYSKRIQKLESDLKSIPNQKDKLDISADSDGSEDEDPTLSAFKAKASLNLNPNKTIGTEDNSNLQSDEQIIALQNKLITFSNEHADSIEKLTQEHNEILVQLQAEKDGQIEELLSKIETLEHEGQLLNEKVSRLRDTERELTRVLSSLNLSTEKESASKEKQSKSKKTKKDGSSDTSMSDLKPPILSSSTNDSHTKLKSSEFIVMPSRITALLVESKKNEASALVELAAIQRHCDRMTEENHANI